MKLIIIGKNTDDKGKQLEELTRKLLETIGYQNVVVNSIRAGGSEIDVRADYSIPNLSGTTMHRVICECKAHSSPIDLPSWLKFLGKIYCEEVEYGKTIFGCYIALSGVNGNVDGNYEHLRSHNKDNISLLHGNDLIIKIRECFNMPKSEIIQNRINACTVRIMNQMDLLYYEGSIYWMCKFDGDIFTLLTSSGLSITELSKNNLVPIIEKETSLGKYMDLEEERKYLDQKIIKMKGLLSILINVDGNSSIDDLIAHWNQVLPVNKIGTINEQEINVIIGELADSKLLFQKTKESISLYPGGCATEHDYTELLKFLIKGTMLSQILWYDFYDRIIDDRLLDRICEIQSNLKLPSEIRSDCISLLRWSPSALRWALHPDDYLVVAKRSQADAISDIIEQHFVKYFLRQLQRLLNIDYNNKMYAQYFYERRGIKEIETDSVIKVKGEKGEIINMRDKERFGIGQAAEEYGGNFLHISILENAPEPWGTNTSDRVIEGQNPPVDR